MGMGGQSHDSAALPREREAVLIVQEAGLAQGQSGVVRKISSPPEFDPRTVHLVARRYTDSAIPARLRIISNKKTIGW